MQIFFITPEAAPFSKAGGLGASSYYLPKALKQYGYEVNVIVPKHLMLKPQKISLINSLETTIEFSFNKRKAKIYKNTNTQIHNTYLVACNELFNRKGIYGTEFGDYEDNAERFIFFNRVALEVINKLAKAEKKIVIHCHDWPTGLLPYYLKFWADKYPKLKKAVVIFTYHNLNNQGLFEHYDFPLTNLDWSLYSPEGLEFHGKFSFTKAGFLGADLISTTSQTYIEETLTHEVALGLEGLINKKLANIYPVLNGVDYEQWNPETDNIIKQQYSQTDLSGKTICKKKLKQLFGLQDNGKAVLAISNSFTENKGYDIICQALPELVKLPLKIVIMSFGNPHYQNILTNLKKQYPEQIGLKIAKDPIMFRYLLSGADFYLFPSRTEPNAIKQLYALQYGAIPIVNNTGNLADTITDVKINKEQGTGYKFYQHSKEDLISTIKTSLNDFEDKEKWQELMQRAMAKKFTWQQAAKQYINLYKKALFEKEI